MITFFAKPRGRTDKKGFTLIELIIVVAILAVLAAVLVPSMVGYMEEANAAVANANARTLYSAASAAAAMAVANGSDVADIGSAASPSVTYGDLRRDSAANLFQSELAGLLGANFEGVFAVDVDGNTVIRCVWQPNATASQAGEYPLPGA